MPNSGDSWSKLARRVIRRNALWLAVVLAVLVPVAIFALWPAQPIRMEAEITASRIQFRVDDDTPHTVLPDWTFQALTVAGFDSIRIGRGADVSVLHPASLRARPRLEITVPRGIHGNLASVSLPGSTLIDLQVPRQSETSLALSMSEPGGVIQFQLTIPPSGSFQGSNISDEDSAFTAPTVVDIVTTIGVFAHRQTTLTVYPDDAEPPGLINPDPIPVSDLDFTRMDLDANRAKSSLMEEATIRYLDFPSLPGSSVASFEFLAIEGRNNLYLEEGMLALVGNRPALKLKVRGEARVLRADESSLLPSGLRRIQHDEYWWPFVAVMASIFGALAFGFQWSDSIDTVESRGQSGDRT